MINVFYILKHIHESSATKIINAINESSDMKMVGFQDYSLSVDKQIKLAKADIVLLDMDHMPIDHAFALSENLAKMKIHLIALTETDADPNLVKLIEKGIDSLILKSETLDIAKTLRLVQEGHFFMPQGVKRLFWTAFNEQEANNKEIFAYQLHHKNVLLTRRESEIAYLIKKDLKNNTIARLLGITEGTVKVHITQIYKKIGIKQRKAVVRLLNNYFISNE